MVSLINKTALKNVRSNRFERYKQRSTQMRCGKAALRARLRSRKKKKKKEKLQRTITYKQKRVVSKHSGMCRVVLEIELQDTRIHNLSLAKGRQLISNVRSFFKTASKRIKWQSAKKVFFFFPSQTHMLKTVSHVMSKFSWYGRRFLRSESMLFSRPRHRTTTRNTPFALKLQNESCC